MYWLLKGNMINPLLFLTQCILWSVGGWLLSSVYFSIKKNRLLAGISLGLSMHLVFSNLLIRIIPAGTGFWASAVLILVLGAAAAFLERESLPRPSISEFQSIFWLLVFTFMISLIGRGVSIFDDRKNLSLISIMAAGDIPPHFYMNPESLFSYHYGFQMIGANLMRTGGFFPWSAFDLSKGFTAALAILMCYTWAESFLESRSWGLRAAFLFTFAAGSRWLLLLVPQSLLIKASEQISLWGNNALSGETLFEALTSPWVLQGGPPFPIPFVFNSGVFPPFILSTQAGPRSLGCVTMFLALLLIPRLKNWQGAGLLALIFALWALAAEAAFGLILIGFVLYTLLIWTGLAKNTSRKLWYLLLLAFVLGGLLSLFQGGTFTEIAKDLFLKNASPETVNTGSLPFTLRSTPAIVSSHLGELSITSPLQFLVGLCEIGVALLMIPLVLWNLKKWLKNGDPAPTIYALSSLTGILLPLFLAYDVDRDITRLSTYAMTGFVLLSLPVLKTWTRLIKKHTALAVVSSWTGFLCLGGVVIFGSLLTAVPAATFGDEIAPLDAAMTRELWDQLDPGALVLDSHEWRSVVVTGRLIKSSQSSFTRLQEWRELVETADPAAFAQAGYSYVYMDDSWWHHLTEEERSAMDAPCVDLVLRKTDNCANCGRSLFDIRTCGTD